MHIGQNGKASKTDCMCVPPPNFFKQPSLQPTNVTPLLAQYNELDTSPSEPSAGTPNTDTPSASTPRDKQ